MRVNRWCVRGNVDFGELMISATTTFGCVKLKALSGVSASHINSALRVQCAEEDLPVLVCKGGMPDKAIREARNFGGCPRVGKHQTSPSLNRGFESPDWCQSAAVIEGSPGDLGLSDLSRSTNSPIAQLAEHAGCESGRRHERDINREVSGSNPDWATTLASRVNADTLSGTADRNSGLSEPLRRVRRNCFDLPARFTFRRGLLVHPGETRAASDTAALI